MPALCESGRRGPPPFIMQLLRAPLSLNNVIALLISFPLHQRRRAAAAITVPVASGGHCSWMKGDAVLGFLALLFAISTVHNMLAMFRAHRIRRQVFGKSSCAERRRWRQQYLSGTEDEEQKRRRLAGFEQIRRIFPSLTIAVTDTVLATLFFGLYILTTLLAQQEGKVEIGFAYANIGALVACILNLLIGISGMKMWSRQRRESLSASFAGNEEARPIVLSEKM